MVYWFCGVICGSSATLLLYSIMVGKRIQEEQDKACKFIYKYEEYRRKIRVLEYQKRELEKKLKSSDYSDFHEVK